ncbi:MAG: patatin family protein [Ruminococcaceae bacterium]|nr:patatin family protein [Oscillospiraceae bacterium]
MSKIGLVLEGGAMRGIYTAGVLDVFMEKGLRFDGVIGVSAGAIHGCSFVSGQHGRSLRYIKKYRGDYRFMSVRSFLRTGNVVDPEFCYKEIPERLDVFDNEAFMQSPTQFYVTCADLETGHAHHQHITDMNAQIDYLRASASLPYFSKIVEIDGRKYLDGGCADSIPVMAFREMGYTHNVLVLTHPADHVRHQEHRGFTEIIYKDYPRFVSSLQNHYKRYNATLRRIEELEKSKEVFVIRPAKKLKIGRMERDLKTVQKVYDIGRADALACMEELIQWMQNETQSL